MTDRKYVRNLPRMIQKMRYYHTMNVGKTQYKEIVTLTNLGHLGIISIDDRGIYTTCLVIDGMSVGCKRRRSV